MTTPVGNMQGQDVKFFVFGQAIAQRKANTCSGASDEFARGKERSYVASLEGYCERLESRIAELRRRKGQLHADESGFVRESSITAASPPDSHGQVHRKEVSDIDDLVGDFGFLSVNATSRDFHGIQSNTSFANLLLSLSVAEPIPKRSAKALPARHEITTLLQHYFDTFFTQLPFFVETSFWTSVDMVYQANGRFAKPFDHWFLRMILATTYASISYQFGDQNHQYALSFASSALDYAEDVLQPGSIAGIQAIMLLAQYSLVDPKHFRSWYLVGMAARALVDLGLHQDPPSDVPSTDEQLDLRRRVCHSVYCLDRCVSAALERTFSFSDDSVNVALPAAGSGLTEPSLIFLHSSEPAWHLIKIRRILSAGYQRKYFNASDLLSQTVVSNWTLYAEASEWFDHPPKAVPQYFPMLYKLELLYTTVMILSPTCQYCNLCDYDKVLLFDRCMQYIAEFHRILKDDRWLPFMTFLDIQRVYQVSVRFTDVVARDFDLVLSSTVPALPPLPYNALVPPILDAENTLNSHARAIECLIQIQVILQFGVRKWRLDGLLDGFQQHSACVRGQLMQPSVAYFPGSGAHVAGQLPPAGVVYPGVQPI
ncbi:fungal specific transcription factor domain-containing protein [Aspergillus tanneri]|uniref:Xylanolytic transcriptional activator regulatory domain-containing protein n=1 Tax=Aspergillus tanneri TaxID=1220188 RepID=A0A5M9MHV4_9EURO|nr:uncharacterized protein ATNIH1004_008788 [Aspergillus tanneri]KAA8644583.1 hypothetical protein ATNIH1004_008788 [Aspergillus tanneri]